MKRTCAQRRPRAKAQRGIVLIIALVVLVVMTVTGLLMFRTTGTGVEVAGNVGFKQNATSMADLGTEAGFKWVYDQRTNPTVLNTDIPAAAYFATWHETFDPMTFDWSTAKEVTADDGTGNRVRYVIHRLCGTPGPPTDVTQKCVIPQSTSGLGPGGGVGGGLPPPKSPYYRITARVDGVRGAVSYTQIIML
ncbi:MULTISPECIES: pilus assembly PilX family protein [unclassified Variovorax]|uniref:pilus assembly PilX family protein n=1 Tax=unclassified Variovorax TaxID=663243 RepID=UPI003F44B7B4